VPAAEAHRRILEAARALLLERPFAELTVDAVMTEAGLARTVFYRHYADLPQMAADLLPDSDAPLIEQIEELEARRPEEVVRAMVDGLVDVYAEHGPLLRAIDDAARHDRAVAEKLDTALVGPRRLIEGLLAAAPDPPPDPKESARVLMATHRAYLLATLGDGRPRRGARPAATRALTALWGRLLG
jgi:AcrR family transcriptional regulator